MQDFYARRRRSFYNISNFALSEVVNLRAGVPLSAPRKRLPFRESSIIADTFFEAQDFKHSVTFELIWGIFPTLIVMSILVPSLYLLYALDEDLDPKLTIKVIGHT
jgi:hypothetical protein